VTSNCQGPCEPRWDRCSIVPLTLEHCAQVASLHLEQLSTGYRGRPGLRLLQTYYAALVQSDGGSGFVAEQMGPAGAQHGAVVGYVCGLWDPAAVRSTLLRDALRAQWPKLAFWTGLQVLIRPRLISELVGRWRVAERRPVPRQAYELRPIVVDATMRRNGIGAQLVDALLADASRRGFRQVHVFAEEGNVAANAFYREIGFRCAERENKQGAARLRYEYTLPGYALSGS
jgi:ribosomal protein S18 acetylase RimI-like enzyme